jgi:hypothetical protein
MLALFMAVGTIVAAMAGIILAAIRARAIGADTIETSAAAIIMDAIANRHQ